MTDSKTVKNIDDVGEKKDGIPVQNGRNTLSHLTPVDQEAAQHAKKQSSKKGHASLSTIKQISRLQTKNNLRQSDTNQLLAYSIYDPSNLATAIQTKVKKFQHVGNAVNTPNARNRAGQESLAGSDAQVMNQTIVPEISN